MILKLNKIKMKNLFFILFCFITQVSYSQISTISATDGSILITPRGLLGKTNSSSTSNVALGYGALINNTTWFANTVIGINSLYFNTTGSSNTANGVSSLQSNKKS